MKNSDVASAWIAGRAASTRNFRTDGKSLWSYGLKIADELQIFNYTASGRAFRSQTTSTHVGLARNAAPYHPITNP